MLERACRINLAVLEDEDFAIGKQDAVPSFVGVKSMRKLPGTDIASYQVSTFEVPSGSMFVVC